MRERKHDLRAEDGKRWSASGARCVAAQFEVKDFVVGGEKHKYATWSGAMSEPGSETFSADAHLPCASICIARF